MTVAAASWGRLSLCVVLGECAWPVLEHLTQVSGPQVEKGSTSRPVVTRLDGEPHTYTHWEVEICVWTKLMLCKILGTQEHDEKQKQQIENIEKEMRNNQHSPYFEEL